MYRYHNLKHVIQKQNNHLEFPTHIPIQIITKFGTVKSINTYKGILEKQNFIIKHFDNQFLNFIYLRKLYIYLF